MGVSVPACMAAIAASLALAAGAAPPSSPAHAKTKPGKAAPAKAAASKASNSKGATPAAAPAASPSTIVYVIRRTEDSWTVMDPGAVETLPGGAIRRAYSVTVRRNLLNGGPPQPGYVRTLNDFDCEAYKHRWRTFTIYNRFGAVVVKQDNPEPAFAALNRGSEEEAIFRSVCDGGGGGSVVAAPSLGQLVIGLMQAWDEAAMADALPELAPAIPPPAAKPPVAKPGAKPATVKPSVTKPPKP